MSDSDGLTARKTVLGIFLQLSGKFEDSKPMADKEIIILSFVSNILEFLRRCVFIPGLLAILEIPRTDNNSAVKNF